MKAVFAIALIIIAILLTSVVLYTLAANQNEKNKYPIPSPTPSTTPAAMVTANLNITQHRDVNNQLPYTGGYLVISGSVLNNSTNNAYNVGLKVYDTAMILAHYSTVINVSVPIASGIYITDSNYALSTLSPYQSVSISMIIYPDYQSQEPDLQSANVTLVWSNMP